MQSRAWDDTVSDARTGLGHDSLTIGIRSMSSTLRWGIIGTGNIARQFCEGVRQTPRGKLVAVASRSGQSAKAFAEEHGVDRGIEGYAALVSADDVDAVYIALPNSLHAEWTIRALKAGKHVLCEKPLATSAKEAERMFAAARQADRLLVEAFMYRCHPQMHKVCELVTAGAIGDLRMIQANFCYRMKSPEGNIRFDPDLGGGALMDIGCYCLDFCRWLVGQCLPGDHEPNPIDLGACAAMHPGGIDENVLFKMRFHGNILAVGQAGMGVQMNNALRLGGTEGYLTIDVPWKPPQHEAIVRVNGQAPPKMEGGGSAPGERVHRIDADHPLFGLEAEAFAAAALDGRPPFIAEAETIGNHRVMDRLKAMIRAGG